MVSIGVLVISLLAVFGSYRYSEKIVDYNWKKLKWQIWTYSIKNRVRYPTISR
jgi:hypothetical protein